MTTPQLPAGPAFPSLTPTQRAEVNRYARRGEPHSDPAVAAAALERSGFFSFLLLTGLLCVVSGTLSFIAAPAVNSFLSVLAGSVLLRSGIRAQRVHPANHNAF
jgi:hypothetical protein